MNASFHTVPIAKQGYWVLLRPFWRPKEKKISYLEICLQTRLLTTVHAVGIGLHTDSSRNNTPGWQPG